MRLKVTLSGPSSNFPDASVLRPVTRGFEKHMTILFPEVHG